MLSVLLRNSDVHELRKKQRGCSVTHKCSCQIPRHFTPNCYISGRSTGTTVYHSCGPCVAAWWCPHDWTPSQLLHLTQAHLMLSVQAGTVCSARPESDCAARMPDFHHQCPACRGTSWSAADSCLYYWLLICYRSWRTASDALVEVHYLLPALLACCHPRPTCRAECLSTPHSSAP